MTYVLDIELPPFLSRDDHGWVHITDRRVSLFEIVAEFNQGMSAESLAARFPTISLARIHHVIAFYLDHQKVLDAYFQTAVDETARARNESSSSPKTLELRKRVQALHAARMKASHAS